MLPMKEFAARRQQLMRQLGNKAIVILPAAKEVSRNGDAVYPFRQNSDFYYLTGFEEPDAVLVLAPGRSDGQYILFNRVRDKDREIWDGPRVGQENACKVYLADQAFPIEQVSALLPALLQDRSSIHYPIGAYAYFDQLIIDALNSSRAKIRGGYEFPEALVDITPSLHEMRLFKSKNEIAAIKKAVDISAEAHLAVMQKCKPGLYEYELEAEFVYRCMQQDARQTAYNSIVGAGKNSCVLHYISNQDKIVDGDLVLIDAGAEYKNYAADITRTIPANGKFNKEQRAIYELVLASQIAAIKTIKPGVSFLAAQSAIVEVLTQGLLDLGLLHGKYAHLLETQAYLPFYMHRSGHWLGLDVHDAGRYRINNQWRPLEPGMVLTIEPGLYIDSTHAVDKRWLNIGVRIEDDVVVTEDGCEILSKEIPKTVTEIENIMQKN